MCAVDQKSSERESQSVLPEKTPVLQAIGGGGDDDRTLTALLISNYQEEL